MIYIVKIHQQEPSTCQVYESKHSALKELGHLIPHLHNYLNIADDSEVTVLCRRPSQHETYYIMMTPEKAKKALRSTLFGPDTYLVKSLIRDALGLTSTKVPQPVGLGGKIITAD